MTNNIKEKTLKEIQTSIEDIIRDWIQEGSEDTVIYSSDIQDLAKRIISFGVGFPKSDLDNLIDEARDITILSQDGDFPEEVKKRTNNLIYELANMKTSKEEVVK